MTINSCFQTCVIACLATRGQPKSTILSLKIKPAGITEHHDCFRINHVSSDVSVFRSDKVTVHFINRDGEKITVKGSPGESLLDVVINEDLDIDGFGMCTHSVL